MHFLYLMPFYLKWHYTEGFVDLSRNWKSLLAFVLYFFSLGLLFRTWLAPFGRLDEDYKKGLDPEVFFETLVVNTVMRVVGFVLKSIVMLMGFLALVLTSVLGLAGFFFWALAPLVILTVFILGAVNILF